MSLTVGDEHASEHLAVITHLPDKPVYEFTKRLIDIAVSSIALLLAAPFLAIIAVFIKIISPGPVIFTQQRAGKNGKAFTIYKFRTMVPDAEARLREVIDPDGLQEPVFKVKGDPRVTPFGKFLRASSIDEFPQFVNVLLGDITLVGPRPEEVWLVQRYNSYERQRLLVKPGITGPMQVSGRGGLSLRERVGLEVEYIQRRSIILDLYYLIKTVPAVLFSRGAY